MMSIETATTPLKKKIEDVKKLFVAIHKSKKWQLFSIALKWGLLVLFYLLKFNSLSQGIPAEEGRCVGYFPHFN